MNKVRKFIDAKMLLMVPISTLFKFFCDSIFQPARSYYKKFLTKKNFSYLHTEKSFLIRLRNLINNNRYGCVERNEKFFGTSLILSATVLIAVKCFQEEISNFSPFKINLMKVFFLIISRKMWLRCTFWATK